MRRRIIITVFFITVGIFADEGPQIPKDIYGSKTSYRVKIGETLGGIASKHKVSVSYLLTLNDDIYNPNEIYAYQLIKVPDETAVSKIEKLSHAHIALIKQLGAAEYPDRKQAIIELKKLDWQGVPLLLQALHQHDPEVRENAREVLRALHKRKKGLRE